MANLAIWPGFARAKKGNSTTQNALSANDKWLMTNGGAFVPGATPDFKVTRETTEADAQLFAQMWLKHPAYRMMLPSTHKAADTDGDGQISAEEFKTMLSDSGYTGASAASIFQQIDKDGDGQLTEAEIKMLSQGSDTLVSGKAKP